MKIKSFVKDLCLVFVGNFLLALAVSVFILPFNILSGGVAGIAVALEPLTGMNPKHTIDILIVGTFILGTIFLGKSFAIKTVFSSIFYPLFLSLIGMMNLPMVDVDPMLASLYGGLLAGLGIGIVFRAKASTGGMDVPPLIIHKYTGISVSKLVLIIDALTVLLGLSSYGLSAVLVGFISVWTCSFMINKVLLFGGESAKSVQIISQHTETINKAIHDKLDRGTTILNAQGGFTGDERQVILVVIMNNQYPELVSLVSEIDSKAFLIVQDATEVKGEGFSLEYKV